MSFEEEAKYLAKASENLRDATILAVDTDAPEQRTILAPVVDVDLTARAERLMEWSIARQGKTDSAQRSLPPHPPRAAEKAESGGNEQKRQSRSHLPSPSATWTSRLYSIHTRKGIEDAELESFEFYCRRPHSGHAQHSPAWTASRWPA